MSAASGTRAIVAALGANLGIAATKFIAFALTGSSSMLAEAIHSVADSGNQALLLVGGRRARREATPEHPFGFGRERYVYAFIVAIVLFSVGGLFALYEGYQKLSTRNRSTPGNGSDRGPGDRHRAGGRTRSAPRSRRATSCGPERHGSRSSAGRGCPSCRSCCWRTSPR